MNFTHLKAFFTVAKLKSFTKAAVELSVSQPTLSLQVQSLENQYDIVLINRTKKSIELTEEGKTVYSFADTIFSLSRDLENTIEDLNMLRSGKLQIGTTPTIARYMLPDIIQTLKQHNPDLRLQLYTGLSREVLSKVTEYEYHIGIIGRVPYPGNIIARPILNPELYFITSGKMNRSIHLRELANHPVIFPEQGSVTREYIIRQFQKRNIPLNDYIDCENPSALKHMVQLGMGGAFLPWYSIESDIKEGKYNYVKVLDGLSMNIDLVYLQERRKSKSIKTFNTTLNEYRFPKSSADEETVSPHSENSST